MNKTPKRPRKTKNPNKARDEKFIRDMYEGVAFSEFEMKQAIREHELLIELFHDLGCDLDDDDDDSWLND